MEGHTKPTEAQAEDNDPLRTPCLLYTPRGTLLQRQGVYHRANQVIYSRTQSCT